MKISFLLNKEPEQDALHGHALSKESDARAGRQSSRRYWSKHEDELLRSLVEKHGRGKWTLLAQQFDDRSACQLRCRWAYAVSNSRSQRPFTPEEDRFILEQYSLAGSRWTLIAGLMEDRLGNDVKNRIRLLERRRRRESGPIRVDRKS
eukprot:CAMPEP_0185830580 /NCGR_PEP_ID=MMETSP1353-20130828/953_1 /TAXON_ID=1077150 /ORGANISM="Erythrolobus australicus, Strain CCMP3124" /LENGTH=148 /DNA_ID=CAMNT_0028528523 /DNA_START=472 /DNA_END=918 /DNA_ORIENTATION=+